MPVFQLSDDLIFPPPFLAREDGLLAVGGDLSLERILLAYQNGIFPWYSEGEPILWWSPDPRLILEPHHVHVSKRLARLIRQNVFKVTFDTAFADVISSCAAVRKEKGELTWIVEDMVEAYCTLHEAGYAHSVECWQDDSLAGGLYGITLGKVFFGESMFSRVPNSSKVALAHLCTYLAERNFDMIDCQMTTPHLIKMGAHEISGDTFRERLAKNFPQEEYPGKWLSAEE